MTSKTGPKGYSGLQIGLHWAVVMLLLIQYLAHDGIEHAWRALRQGSTPPAASTVQLHVIVGASIFVLALWRLYLRLTRGVPALPDSEPAPIRLVVSATHLLIYVLLVGMPIAGSLAWYGGLGPAAGAHVLASNALLALVILHVLGAFVQQFVMKTNVLTRMAVADD